jgi:hypothetical protein
MRRATKPPERDSLTMTPLLLTELRKLASERAKLSNPVDRIAFDNQWKEGVPVGLLLMVVEAIAREEGAS